MRLKNVCVRESRLVGVAYVSCIVVGSEVGFRSLFKCVVEACGERVGAAHQGGKAVEVVRNRPGGLPCVCLDPSPAVERIAVEPRAVGATGHNQPDFRVVEACPARGAAVEAAVVGFLAHLEGHLAHGPVLEGGFERYAGIVGEISVALVEINLFLAAEHAVAGMVAHNVAVGLGRIAFGEHAFLEGAGYEARGGAGGHYI